MDDHHEHRHFSVEFHDGATITLPPEAWLNQDLVRSMLAAARDGREPARMSDEDWQAFVWTVADRAAAEDQA